MASDLENLHQYLDLGYNVAALSMSTPMLVNDWKEPHRTMLLIVAPEKPITITEADAVYDFVTKKGGKVLSHQIIAMLKLLHKFQSTIQRRLWRIIRW